MDTRDPMTVEERTIEVGSGLLWLVGLLIALPGTLLLGAAAANSQSPLAVPLLLASASSFFLMFGLFTVAPNEARVLQLFGAYRGTVRKPGLRWANPFLTKARISLRVRNFETGKLKVNDNHGNPIEIGAVVVWRVVDTAEASFHVNDYKDFVHVQSEAALRNLATRFPYDAHGSDDVSLSGHTAEISDMLKVEVQDRLARAGVEVLEARISYLAYAKEIAAAMLRRQQASAIVAARQQIVEGAVGMVETALEMLSRQRIVDLDEDRKAAMVSNLLVVLCSETHTQPIVNTGTGPG